MSKQLDSILSRATTATPKLIKSKETEPTPAASGEAPIQSSKKTTKKAKAPEAQKAIQAYVPASVAKAINIRAAQEEITVRTIILQGLQAIGIDVPDDEVRDKRR